MIRVIKRIVIMILKGIKRRIVFFSFREFIKLLIGVAGLFGLLYILLATISLLEFLIDLI